MAIYYTQTDLNNTADFWSCEVADRMDILNGRLSMGQDCQEEIDKILLLEMGIEVLGQYTPITTLDDQTNNHVTESELEDFIEFVNDELNICGPKKGDNGYTRRSLPPATTHLLLQEDTNHILLEGGGFIILEEYHGD